MQILSWVHYRPAAASNHPDSSGERGHLRRFASGGRTGGFSKIRGHDAMESLMRQAWLVECYRRRPIYTTQRGLKRKRRISNYGSLGSYALMSPGARDWQSISLSSP